MPSDTALHKACHNGDFVQVKVLVEEEGTPIDAAGASDRRPIHRAIGGNHLEIAKYLVEKGASVNQTDRSGRSALHWGVISGHAAAVGFLVDAGADLRAATRSNMTALHAAAGAGRADLVRTLVAAAGADGAAGMFDARDDEGKTAYDLAREGNKKEAVKCLRELGDPSAKSKGFCVIS